MRSAQRAPQLSSKDLLLVAVRPQAPPKVRFQTQLTNNNRLKNFNKFTNSKDSSKRGVSTPNTQARDLWQVQAGPPTPRAMAVVTANLIKQAPDREQHPATLGDLLLITNSDQIRRLGGHSIINLHSSHHVFVGERFS